MRFKELNLKSFGAFEEYKLDFPYEKDFHLVFGNNEAGKSTILRSIIALLYGIPLRSKDDFRYDKISVAGTIVGNTHDGEEENRKEIAFTRRKGMKNTIVDDDNNPLGEDFLDSILNNVDKEAFTNMFGLDHIRLREGGENILKGGGQVGETLFETAAGLTHIREIVKEIEKESGDLFKKSGSKPILNSNIKLFREEKKRIKELSLSSANWKELEKSYKDSKKEIEIIADKLKALRKKISYYERIKRILPLVSERRSSIRQLEALGDIPELRKGFREERIKITELYEKKAEDKDNLKVELDELDERLKATHIPEELIASGVLVSELHEQLDAYRNVIKEIPGITDECNKVKEEAISLLKEINPELTDLSQSDQLMLSHDLKEEINRLCEENVELNKDRAINEERIRSIEKSLQKKESEKKKLGSYYDHAHLKSLLNKVSKYGDIEEIIRKNTLKRDSLKNKIMEKLNSLTLWRGSVEEFRMLPLVLPETVSIFEEKFEAVKEKINDNVKEKKRCRENMQALKKQLAENEAGVVVPTESELTEKRKKRDMGWQLIKKSWLFNDIEPESEEVFKGELSLDDAYEESVKDADYTSDIRYNEAEAAALKENLLDSIRSEEERYKVISSEEESLDNQLVTLKEQWEGVWNETGIKPLSPREMFSWLQNSREVKEQIASLAELDGEIYSLKELIDYFVIQIEREIIKLNGDKDVAVDERESKDSREKNIEDQFNEHEKLSQFSSLFTEAQQRVENLEKLAVNLKSNKEDIDDLNDDLKQVLGEQAKLQEKENNWKKQWQDSMKYLKLSTTSHCSVALSRLRKNEELFNNLRELKELQLRLDNMSKYKKSFEEKAAEVLEKTAEDLCGSPYHLAVSELIKRYENTQKESVTAEEIKARMKKLNNQYNVVCKEVEDLQNKLKKLMAEVSCTNIKELAVAEEKHKTWESLNEEISRLDKSIIRESEGMSIDEVLNDVEPIDGDNLVAELEECHHEIARIEEERAELDRMFGVIKKDYEEKIKGNSEKALQAAENAQSILADIAADSEKYLTLKLGAAILKRGIENYRQENQDPVLKKASELFSRLTLNSFCGLTVEYDDKDEAVLVGVRDGGRTVGVEGMSDGTQDQLYLALRLAFIEKYCEETAQMPLIFDDILINFDDKRAGETLKILGELSQKTQIIFFTHHSKLLALAKDSISEKTLMIHNIEAT